LIFLAGPIQGTSNWQSRAIEIIQDIAPGINIACPRRNIESYQKGNFTKEMYNEQVDWETHYLRQVAKKGVILFWLAKETEHKCDRAYAQTTRLELGEWKVMHELKGTKIVIGIEDKFTGAKYIKRRFLQDCPDVEIHSILEETCAEAMRLLTD
jgi:hypothetical protein